MSPGADPKLISEPPLLVLPSLAAAIGLNEALLLQQLHYQTRESDLAWWPPTTGKLREQFPFWSWPTIRRTLASLEREGLVKVRQDGRDRTKRYRVQIDALHRLNLSTKRSDASTQIASVSSLSRKRGEQQREEAPARKFSRFDQAVQR